MRNWLAASAALALAAPAGAQDTAENVPELEFVFEEAVTLGEVTMPIATARGHFGDS